MTSDRIFTIAFGLSLGIHLTILIGQALSLDWFKIVQHSKPIEVVYDYETAKKEVRALQDQVTRAERDAVAAPLPAANIGERMQIRVPDHPALAADRSLLEAMPAPSSVVDLSDLVGASRGNPVLLSYFGVIREQIQRQANDPRWLTTETARGLVYISFKLSANGSVHDVAVVSDRSVPSRTLQDIALRIVKAAAPFPPFPPSMSVSSQVILQPLEFLSGS